MFKKEPMVTTGEEVCMGVRSMRERVRERKEEEEEEKRRKKKKLLSSAQLRSAPENTRLGNDGVKAGKHCRSLGLT